MSIAAHGDQAPATTPTTSSATAPQSATPSQSGTGWPKLARGEIPSTWSKPAEVVTTVPSRTKGAWPVGPIVGLVVAVGTAAFVFVALPNLRGSTTTSTATSTIAPVTMPPPVTTTARAIEATPSVVAATTTTITPPSITPPSITPPSITPTTITPTTITPTTPPDAPVTTTIARVDVAEAIPAPPPTSSTTPENAVAPEDQGGDANADAATADDVVTELPARKKAKGLTARGIAALRGGDVAGAEPLLVRAVLVDPSLADAWRHLGIARAQLGDVEGARRAYRKYLELAPKAPDAAQVRAILAAP